MEINKKTSDGELENIFRKAENIGRSGSQFEKAQIELDIRRKRKLFELQENMFDTIQTRLDRIVKLLEYVNKKPIKTALIGGLIATLIGVLINVFSELTLSLLRKILPLLN